MFLPNNKLALKHGKSYSRVHGIWRSMLYRCLNPKSHQYQYYGGRGITVCERWKKFENFYADMGDPPAHLTLERKNNVEGYTAGNCRWVTRKEQANNRRQTTKLTAGIVSAVRLDRMKGLSYRALAKKYGLSRSLMHLVGSGHHRLAVGKSRDAWTEKEEFRK